MISIIIVNWNTRQITINCINSIVENTIIPYEIIVIDNCSTDGSQEALGKINLIKLIRNDANVGFAKANNQGMLIAQGDVFLLLNSDTIILGNAIEDAYRILKSDPTFAMVGCKLLNEDLTLQRSCSFFPSLLTPILGKQIVSKIRNKYFPFFSTRLDSAYLDEEHDQPLFPDWIMGAFMMVRKEAVDQVGMFDEDYFMYDEDMDWCYRFKKAGWGIHYIPDTAIVHFGGASSSAVPRKTMARHVASTLLFFIKHHGTLACKLYAIVNVIALTIEVLFLLITFRFIGQKRLQILKQLFFKLLLMCKGLFFPIKSLR
jgi:GT2 family glycosyltransferase